MFLRFVMENQKPSTRHFLNDRTVICLHCVRDWDANSDRRFTKDRLQNIFKAPVEY